MSRLCQPWPFLFLVLLALAGCAAQGPPTHPAAALAPVGSPPPDTEAAEPSPLPAVVEENQTFVTIEGVARYKIGPGDVLEVLLTKELAQDRLSVTVRANGKVTLGFAEATVAGLTTEQAASEIQRMLAPTHKELTVEVTVKEYKSKVISVLGEVAKDGRYPLQGKTNLLDLLAEAGGPTSAADLSAVRLLRQDGQSYTINLFRLVSEGRRFRELILDAGDRVFVPTRSPAEEKKVFLLGEVRNPGAYPFTPNMRLSQALALAGGPKETAVLDSARVIRGNLRNPQVVEVDFNGVIKRRDLSQDVPLESNDLIVVPRSAIGNWNAFLAQIRPTLEFLSLPLQPFTQYLLIRELIK